MVDQPRQTLHALYCPLCGGRLWSASDQGPGHYIVLTKNEINVRATIGQPTTMGAPTRIEMSRRAGSQNIISTDHVCPAVLLHVTEG